MAPPQDTWTSGLAKGPVIRRVRFMAPEAVTPAKISIVEPIYTRAALIRVFAIPDAAQTLLPADPAEPLPANIVWAWKERFNCAVLQRNGIEETVEWEQGAWPLYLFDLVT